MILLTSGIVAAVAFGLVWVSSLRGDHISVYLAATMWALHFLVPGMYALSGDPQAGNYANDAIFNLALLAGYAALLFGLAIQHRRPNPQTIVGQRSEEDHNTPPLGVLVPAVAVSYTAFLVSAFVASLDFVPEGVSRSYLALSTRQDAVVSGSWDFLGNVFTIVAYFSLHKMLQRRGTTRHHGIRLFYLWLLLQLGTMAFGGLYRSPILFLVVTYLIVTHLIVRPIRWIGPALAGILLVSPIVMSQLAYFRADARQSNTPLGLTEQVLHGTTGFGTALEFYGLVTESRQRTFEFEYGRQLVNTSLVWVPRAVWSDKPVVSFSFRKTEELYGRVGPRNWVRTFTAWGEGFTQFGYLGVVFYSLLLALVVSSVKALWVRVPELTYPVVSYVVSFPLLARGDLFSFVARLIPLGIVAGVVLIWRASHPSEAGQPPLSTSVTGLPHERAHSPK